MAVFARLRARVSLLASDLRADLDEVAACYAGDLADVDLTAVPSPLADAPDDVAVSPLARLRATEGVIVSRDFRAAGKGAQWDRVREYDPKVHGWPKNKKRGQARGSREWEQVSTIVLHTAGVNGLHPDRWLGVPCHAAVANDATVVLCHDLRAYLWAAHAANRYSCSLEVAGNKAITPAQIPAARALLRYVVEELRLRRPKAADGGPLPLYVAPHRFSHRSRVNDCGPEIWREVGEWGMSELGLGLGPVVGSGNPLPW